MVETPSSPPPAPRRARTGVTALVVVVALLLAAGAAVVVVRRGGDEGPGAASPAPAAPAPSGPATPTTPPTASRADPAAVETLKSQVAAIRGLAWKRPLTVNIISPDELARRLRDFTLADREKNRDRMAGDEATLKLLDLIPDRTDYAKIIDELLAGGVLGFYDDETKELFVGGDPGDGGEIDAATRSVIVHELTHALTDQHFDYGPPTKALGDADRTEELAGYIALLEGDAELVSLLWQERHLDDREQAEALFGQAGGNPLAALRAPRYVLDALRFPYEDGLAFVSARYDAGGFAAVDAAYRRPPASTEHILHPELYEAGPAPAPPALPDLAAATGCAPVDTGVLGEFDMAKVLREHVSTARADRAAAGWNGDAFRVVRCGATLGLADRWRADTAPDAIELAQVLSDWARGWSGGNRAPDAEGRFSGPSGAGRIVRSGSRVDLVLAGDPATADRVGQALPAA